MSQRMNKLLVLAAVVVPVMSVALWPAAGQPGQGGGKDGGGGQQGGGRQRDRVPSGEGRGPRSEWAEKYRTELREHPRLARALVALHEAKDYLEKPAAGAGDFGGNKDATIKACDEAIKKLTEAMKFDPKREPGNSGGRGPDDDGEKKDKDKDKDSEKDKEKDKDKGKGKDDKDGGRGQGDKK